MQGRRPLLLLVHGDIHTMAPDAPRATALALDRGSGQIVAVGDDAEIGSLRGPLSETIDLRGRVVLPGFIDAHTHLTGYASSRLDVHLRGTRSEDEAVGRVRQRAEQTPVGRWIIGHSWDKNGWPGERFPTAASLDAAVPAHPVVLWNHDAHSMWVNSEALRRAGIDATTPDPPDGRIARDGDGTPTGMLFEPSATGLIDAVVEPPDAAVLLAELRRVLAEMAASGITGIHNIEDANSLRLIQQLRREGGLRPRVLFYLYKHALRDALRLGLEAGFGDDTLRLAGIKLFMDGALGSQTAALLMPYEGQPGNRGLLTTSETEAEETVRAAADGNLGVAIHAIGDRAVRAAIDGIEAAMRATPAQPAPRYRLEHVQLAAPEDIARMARLGIVASVQPFHAVADRAAAERYWGARHRRAYAYQTLRSAGIPLALGSDVPVDTSDPARILHAAVARRDDQAPDTLPWLPDQALTITQALWGYTVGAAYAGGQEARQGSLAPGKLADLVVLGDDLFTLPADRLAELRVVATLVGGELVAGAL